MYHRKIVNFLQYIDGFLLFKYWFHCSLFLIHQVWKRKVSGTLIAIEFKLLMYSTNKHLVSIFPGKDDIS